MATGSAHIQYGDHYPLVNPSEDIKYLIVDMIVSHHNPEWEYALPLRIKQFNRRNGMLVLVNDNDEELFRGTCDSHGIWGDKFTLFKWSNDTTIIKAVINNEIQTSDNLYPQQAVLDLRAVWCAPKHVLTINGNRGDFVFAAGHNIDLYAEDNTFHIDAVAGAGTGIVTDVCETKSSLLGIKSINGVEPDENGSIFIKTENGPQITEECHTLIIENSNQPCCLCSDMCSFAEYLTRIVHEILLTKAKAEWLRDTYKEQLEYWLSLPVCSTAEAVYLQLDPGQCPYATLTIRITNMNHVSGSFSLKGSFDHPMLLISETTTETEMAEDNQMLLWFNDEPQNAYRRYPRQHPTTGHYNQGINKPVELTWSCVPPGSSVSHTGKYKLNESPEPNAPYPLKFTINEITVNFSDGTTASIGSPFLSGQLEAEIELDCGGLPQDTVTNPDAIKDINAEIWKRKREFWPCPGDELLHFGHKQGIDIRSDDARNL